MCPSFGESFPEGGNRNIAVVVEEVEGVVVMQALIQIEDKC